MKNRRITKSQWRSEARHLWGDDPMAWAFVCPSCGHVATVSEWKAAGAGEGMVAFSCIGRALGVAAGLGADTGPCNYAGGGLFQLNPVTVIEEDGSTHNVFEFAPKQETS